MAKQQFEIGDTAYVFDQGKKKVVPFKVLGVRRDADGNVLDYISEEREDRGEIEIDAVVGIDEKGNETRKRQKIKQEGDHLTYPAMAVTRKSTEAMQKHKEFEAELTQQQDEERIKAEAEAKFREEQAERDKLRFENEVLGEVKAKQAQLENQMSEVLTILRDIKGDTTHANLIS